MIIYLLCDLSPYSLPFDFSTSLKELAEKYHIKYDTLKKNIKYHRPNYSIGCTVEKIIIPGKRGLTD